MNRRARISILIMCGLTLVVTSTFNACGNVGHSNKFGGNWAGSSLGTPIKGKGETGYTLQSADQLGRSMADVTGVEIDSTIADEFNRRKSLMTDNYKVESVTSPMLVSITNLGSRYCNKLIDQEAKLAIGERKFFEMIDFSKAVGNVSDDAFNQMISRLSNKVLGRAPSSEEIRIYSEGRAEFIQAIPSGSQGSSQQTRNMVLFFCSGMMSTFDFLTI